ncbi:hypothetical protein PRIEUP_LOCUS1962 [Pristimantis euphronides]
MIVKDKDPVTLQCNFTYPKHLHKDVEVRVSWRKGQDRCGNGNFIYNHTGQTNNKERITPGGDPNNGRVTIKIHNLNKRQDGPMFCCRVEIYKDNILQQGWQNRHGTYMLYTDQFSVEQTDVVPAITGENILVPCIIHYVEPSSINYVSWTMGSSNLCSENKERSVIWNMHNKSQNAERWSLVDFPHNLSLRITNVRAEDNKHYCCQVQRIQTLTSQSSRSGTEVVVLDTPNNPKFKVLQPTTTSPDKDGSATLHCSFRHQYNGSLWTEVFWRVGRPNGPYAYHPLTYMVDSSYKGRTALSGPADLQITGVRDTDNNEYYCFVVLKICVNYNKTKSTVQHGKGTKLQEEGKSKETYHHFSYKYHSGYFPDNPMWIYILAAALPVVILLCATIIIIILKKRGVICQKRPGQEDVNYLTSDIALKDQSPYANMQGLGAAASARPTAQEDSGGLLYAHLNVSSLQQKTSNGKKTDKSDDTQVLYAAVKPTNVPQDIYSTIDK